jgi:hypothetical protein
LTEVRTYFSGIVVDAGPADVVRIAKRSAELTTGGGLNALQPD